MKFINGATKTAAKEPIHHLAIGFFDGVHIGHRAVIQNKFSQSELDKTCVLTFWPHPLQILKPQSEPILLTSLDEKLMLLDKLGVGYVCVEPFTEQLAKNNADSFCKLISSSFPKLQSISVGPNFRYGSNRTGTPLTLAKWCEEKHITFHLSDLVLKNGEPVSSTRIRNLLATGKISEANQLLGSPFMVSGAVSGGQKLGRRIGFPTANIIPNKPLNLPYGVYKSIVDIHDGNTYLAITNFGERPTVNSDISTAALEVHILDFTVDLYHKEIRCSFLDFVRPEIKFSSVDELQLQIIRDIESIKK